MTTGGGAFPGRLGLAVLGLLALTLVGHLGILANPGFYSHDEWEKLDFVRAHGLWGAIRAYASIQPGTEFGYPVRPIGFIQQSISALWMEGAPFLPHLLDVLLHALIASVLMLALLDARVGRRLAFGIALAFSLSPLTMGATGWVGASFDQWYVLFTVLAGWAAFRAATRGLTLGRALGLLAASAGAILSKEAAIVLPGIILVVLGVAFLHRRDEFRGRAAALAVLLVTVPLLAYLAFRLPALENSLAGRSHSTYTPSPANLLRNALGYAAFPFLPHNGDFPAVSRLTSPPMLVALGLHALLVAGVAAYAGRAAALLYVLCYGLFVAMVLPLAIPASHYIYGSAVPMAVALCLVLRGAWRHRHWWALAAVAPGLALMLGNAVLIQKRLYLDGKCQSDFLASLETRLAAPDGLAAEQVAITAERGARSWVGRRAVHDRAPFRDAAGKPRVRFGEAGPGALALVMTRRCLVR